MFIALMVKEWREKALIFLFELAVLAVLLATQFLVRQNKDLREWFVYAVLLLFFPFAALVLGTAAFESEYRQGAWTYLFSRPVGRIMVWGAKFAALLGLFAALWLVFVAAWAAVPAIRDMAAGPRVFLEELAANGFPWWSLGLSLFMFIVAFSLGFLHERYFNLLFVSLLLGLALPAAAWSLFISRTGWFLIWMEPDRAFRSLLIGLALMAAAFIGASLLTFVRADFAQPRKRVWRFVRWFIPLFIGGQALTVATALWLPLPGENFLSYVASTDKAAIYATQHGMFAYDAADGKIRWFEKNQRNLYYLSSIADSRFAYVRADNVRDEIWVCKPDGTERKRVLGRDTPGPWPRDASVRNLVIAPDGRRIAVLIHETRRLSKNRYKEEYSIWTVNADGTGLEQLSLAPLLADGEPPLSDLLLSAWGRETNALVIAKRYRYPSKPVFSSLWLYDLDHLTLTKIQDDAFVASWRTAVSPSGDLLAIRYPYGDPKAARTLALFDLKTRQKSEIVTDTYLAMYGIRWNPAGKLLYYSVSRPGPAGQTDYVMSIYSLSAGKTVAEKTITQSEDEASLFWASWTPDGRSLVASDSGGKGVVFLDPDLQETGRISLPARIQEPWGITVLGRQVLVVDDRTDSLWRYDLDSKRWKRLY
jgi:ABC-type transport system involved in multi-copper enzyme maturation permease subunit